MDISIKKLFFLFTLISFLLSFNTTPINVKNIEGYSYVSISDVIGALGIEYKVSNKKTHIELEYNNNQILITALSSFVIINEVAYDLFKPSIIKNGDIFVLAKPFVSALKRSQVMTNIYIDSSEESIIYENKAFNILSYDIVNKNNGTMITLNTTQLFDNKLISASLSSNGWISLTIPNSYIDSVGIRKSVKQDPVTKVKITPMNQSSQISFLLNNVLEEYEISCSENRIDLLIRTDIQENKRKIKEDRNKWLFDIIVLDAGHGGKDPGAVSPRGTKEKDITLKIVQLLGKKLEKNLGCQVVYTRDSDVFIPLTKRTKIANEVNGKLFISVHANSHKDKRVRGFETYLLRPGKTQDAKDIAHRENRVIKTYENNDQYKKLDTEQIIMASMAQSSFMQESERLAIEIQNQIGEVLTKQRYNRGVKQAGFQVLVGASMPNILIELGFITNREEEKLLLSSNYQEKLAQAIFEAIATFKKKEESKF